MVKTEYEWYIDVNYKFISIFIILWRFKRVCSWRHSDFIVANDKTKLSVEWRCTRCSHSVRFLGCRLSNWIWMVYRNSSYNDDYMSHYHHRVCGWRQSSRVTNKAILGVEPRLLLFFSNLDVISDLQSCQNWCVVDAVQFYLSDIPTKKLGVEPKCIRYSHSAAISRVQGFLNWIWMVYKNSSSYDNSKDYVVEDISISSSSDTDKTILVVEPRSKCTCFSKSNTIYGLRCFKINMICISIFFF